MKKTFAIIFGGMVLLNLKRGPTDAIILGLFSVVVFSPIVLGFFYLKNLQKKRIEKKYGSFTRLPITNDFDNK